MNNIQQLERALDGNIHVVMSSGDHIYTMGTFWSLVYIAVFLVGLKQSGDFLLHHAKSIFRPAKPQHPDEDLDD
jgi:hypothetical protein